MPAACRLIKQVKKEVGPLVVFPALVPEDERRLAWRALPSAPTDLGRFDANRQHTGACACKLDLLQMIVIGKVLQQVGQFAEPDTPVVAAIEITTSALSWLSQLSRAKFSSRPAPGRQG